MSTEHFIVAEAAGSLTPAQIPYDKRSPTLRNGDFTIQGNPTNDFVGTGVNEFTHWSFDFNSCDDCPTEEELEQGLVKLRDARLKMRLEPKSAAITTDSVMIEGLTRIYRDEIRTLPVGVASTVALDLLDMGDQSYAPHDILRIFQEDNYGEIPMEYEEDAIIGYATLELKLEKAT